jgi:hypothetical protein
MHMYTLDIKFGKYILDVKKLNHIIEFLLLPGYFINDKRRTIMSDYIFDTTLMPESYLNHKQKIKSFSEIDSSSLFENFHSRPDGKKLSSLEIQERLQQYKNTDTSILKSDIYEPIKHVVDKPIPIDRANEMFNKLSKERQDVVCDGFDTEYYTPKEWRKFLNNNMDKKLCFYQRY